MTYNLFRARSARIASSFVLCGLLLVAVGCGPPGASTDDGQSTPGPTAAPLEVLNRMVDAYHSAESYADEAQVVLSYNEGGPTLKERLTQSLMFERPNRISFVVEQEAFRATVKCDGDRFVARIIDAATDDMAGQVVVREAPAELIFDDFTRDQTLYDYIFNGVLVAPTQLVLLLNDDPLQVARGEGVQRKILEDGAIDGRACYRVQVDAVAGQPERGAFVFWIDKQNSILRRLEYPSQHVQASLSPQFKNIRLWVDYLNARFDVDASPSEFRATIPDDLLQVSQFVVPPPKTPLAVEAYGKRPGSFQLTDKDGRQVTEEDLLGRVTVLLWMGADSGSLNTLGQLATIRQGYTDNPNVTFYAIQGPDAPRVEADLPILNDQKLAARDGFKIRGYPTLVVLGREGKVQYAELGANPELAATLPGVLTQVLAGEDVGAAQAAQMKAELTMYQQKLVSAMEEGAATVHELPTVQLLPPTSPQRLVLTKLWSNSEIDGPGNILPIETDEGARLLVVTAAGAVAELSADGELAATHQLDLPPEATISYLRSNVDKQGRRSFAASARMGPQVHLFDAQWRRTASYPPDVEEQQGIRDVQLADLSDSGELQAFVGFWGYAGVHAIKLDGTNVWRNRIFPTALSLAVTPLDEDLGSRKLLVTGQLGQIVELNQYGRHTPPYHVGQIRIHYLYAANYAEAQTPFCGISIDAAGNPSAVGLVPGLHQRLVDQWTQPLPPGVMPNQIEWVTSGKLLPETTGQWLIAGPDGSLHVIGDDATFTDYWRTGKRLTGMAIAEDGVLVLATDEEITAWRVERKDEG
jgi:hypothetical protein